MSNRSWTPIVFGYDSTFAGGALRGSHFHLSPLPGHSDSQLQLISSAAAEAAAMDAVELVNQARKLPVVIVDRGIQGEVSSTR